MAEKDREENRRENRQGSEEPIESSDEHTPPGPSGEESEEGLEAEASNEKSELGPEPEAEAEAEQTEEASEEEAAEPTNEARAREAGKEDLSDEDKEEIIAGAIRKRAIIYSGIAIMLALPIVIGFTTLLVNQNLFGFLAFALFVILSGILFFKFCLLDIPASPPHVGLLTIWGTRYPVIAPEGKRLVANFFPFYLGYIRVNVTVVNIDLPIADIYTGDKDKDGNLAPIKMGLDTALTFLVDYWDPWAVIQYINNGGLEGVLRILEDAIRERGRTFGSRKSWDDIIQEKDQLVDEVIGSITSLTNKVAIAKIAHGQAFADVKSLGVRFRRFNVERIIIPKDLEDAARRFRIEEREKAAEKVEMLHARDRISELKVEGLTPDQASEFFLVATKKMEKTVQEHRFSGLEGPGEGLMAGILGFGGFGKGSGK